MPSPMALKIAAAISSISSAIAMLVVRTKAKVWKLTQMFKCKD